MALCCFDLSMIFWDELNQSFDPKVKFSINGIDHEHDIRIYLKESCGLGFNKHFCFKYFMKYALITQILQILAGKFLVWQLRMGLKLITIGNGQQSQVNRDRFLALTYDQT